MAVGGAIEGGDLRPEHVTVAERDAGKVARIETIDTARPTGWRATTIIESVSASVRPGAKSTPIRRTFKRCVSAGGGALETERTADAAKIWPNIAWADWP